MKTTYRIFVLIVLFFMLAGLTAVGAREEYTRSFQKEFPVKSGDKIILDNKFGEIHCNNWEKDLVNIQVTITVTARSEEEAQKIFDRIKVDIASQSGQVTAKTTIGESRFSNSSFSIDYAVMMPAYLDLDLQNKFGDVFLNELSGKANLQVSYGALDVKKLNNSDNLITVKFGSSDITWMKGAVMTLEYSNAEIGYSGSLRLNSKYSDLNADQVIWFKFDFEGGHLDVCNTSIFESRSRFSDLTVGKVEKTLSVDIQYGSCEVDEVPADFSSVSIKNRFGNVTVGISSEASYLLDAHMEFCDLDFPKSKTRLTEHTEEVTSKTFRGTVGTNVNASSRVTVDSQYGNVSLE
jgi:hypothetical protein